MPARSITLLAASFTLVVASLPMPALAWNEDNGFAPNPNSFTSFLNSIEWGDGKKRVFSNLRSCKKIFSSEYHCQFGYVRIEDPIRGNLFCELSTPNYGFPMDGYDRGAVAFAYGRVQHGNPGPCKKL